MSATRVYAHYMRVTLEIPRSDGTREKLELTLSSPVMEIETNLDMGDRKEFELRGVIEDANLVAEALRLRGGA
jgi:hypothetical protein